MDIKENQGVMFPNKTWTKDNKQPRVRGQINVGGKLYEIALWPREAKSGSTYYSVQIKEDKEDKPQEKAYSDINDEIPW